MLFHRVAPSVMVSDLMREFQVGGAILGTLSAFFTTPILCDPLGTSSTAGATAG
jgi:hypothetical protein